MRLPRGVEFRAFTAACAAFLVATAAHGSDAWNRAQVRVGVESGDLRGDDQRVLQAAVDQMAALGGGTVYIEPGRYTMRNALYLRDHVRVVGTPGQTVLVASDGARSPLRCDGDCNERQITLADPSAFAVGDGVSIQDNDAGGFMVTTATLTSQVDEHTFTISTPLYLDYMVSRNASAQIAGPIVGGSGVKDCAVEGLTIDGNKATRGRLDGCRGGGIYLFECEDVLIRDCNVRDYNGDGISFQVSRGVTVEKCTVEGNTSLGLHPGSGSQRPVVRDNVSRKNGGDGLFVCWRVKHGVFERNNVSDNQGAGLSIGHKDTDNVFRENQFVGNAQAGVLFRNEIEPMGAHRNVLERNVILDNGHGEGANGVAVDLRGEHHGVVFRNNTIGRSDANASTDAVGIRRGPRIVDLELEDNTFRGVATEIADRKE